MTNEEITKRRIELIHETARLYNSTNRAQTDKGCVYSATEKSPGCAIGRLIEDTGLKKVLDSIGSVDKAVMAVLPAHLRELGERFLKDLQMFHDTPSLWTEAGLSNAGKLRYCNLLEAYNLLKSV